MFDDNRLWNMEKGCLLFPCSEDMPEKHGKQGKIQA